MQARGLIDHIDENYVHTISTCYKCGNILEPLPLSQWHIKITPLAVAAKKAIKEKKIAFVPKRFEKIANMWLTNFHDWNISRQIVWGIRIPAWHCADCDAWTVTAGETPVLCVKCHGTNLSQDTDNFDTWFSSGQWPFATLKANKPEDFDYFYPLSVMETGYDILPVWVCRMMMLGIYMTGDVPFKTVYLHGLVRDAKGQKMSKSKGNVINPLKMADLYGTDALRFSLVFGTAAGNDQSLSEDKIRGMRNFANKLWNIGRFILMSFETAGKEIPFYEPTMKLTNASDKRIISELNMLIVAVTKNMEQYRYSDAAKKIYDFSWHKIADVYLEKNKERFAAGDTQALSVLRHVFFMILKLLHPFMPFITEELYQKIPGWNKTPLIVSSWPV